MSDASYSPDARLFLFRGSDLLVYNDGDRSFVPSVAQVPLDQLQPHALEPIHGFPTYTAEIPADFAPPASMRFAGLRSLHGQLDTASFRMAGRAVQIVDWDRTNRFCSRCGTPLHLKADERAKQCPSCDLLIFPRLDPAVIVLIRREGELLLARSPRFPAGWYSTLAGFVEPGESLEEAVHREVMEEVGVTLKNLRYFGSQPWPFPRSLMIGFVADWGGGEIQFAEPEIEDARWFPLDHLPGLPPAMSIARQLIDWALENR